MSKAVLFDLDDTLYDTTSQVSKARRNAISAMISSGLDRPIEEVSRRLDEIVRDKGPNYGRHYNDLLTNLGFDDDPKIVASGIVAYHDAKNAYLVPRGDAIRTLLEIRQMGIPTGIVSDGLPIKQWEKIIMLGLKDFFQCIVITEDPILQKPSPKPFLKAARMLGASPEDCIAVGDRPDRDIRAANRANMTSVRLLCGSHAKTPPGCEEEEADYDISALAEIIDIIRRLKYHRSDN